jgi:predicted Rossmann-fold nucleotide-binding protein
MAALNAGTLDAGGKVVGVLHNKLTEEESGEEAIATLKQKGVELLVACGNDLEERKRLLADGADCFIGTTNNTRMCSNFCL